MQVCAIKCLDKVLWNIENIVITLKHFLINQILALKKPIRN